MSSPESFPLQLRSIDRMNRIALAAELATRVYPIYEEYWVGDFHQEVARGIDLGWSYACGQNVDASATQTCLATLEELDDFYAEKEISLLQQTVSVVLCLLRSLTADDEVSMRAVESAVWVAQGVAQDAESMANELDDPPRPDTAVDEERAWAEKALVLLATWKAPPTRKMFDTVGPRPPQWLADWRTRTTDRR